MTPNTPLPTLRVHRPNNGVVELLFVLAPDVPGQLRDLQMLMGALARLFPQAALVALDFQDQAAPHPWVSALNAPPAHHAGAWPQPHLAEVRDMVQALAQRFDLTAERVALAGHGRGATLWLETCLAHPGLAGRVLAFGGGFVGRPHHDMSGTTVHLVHGMADTSSAPQDVLDAARALVDLGADITADLLPDEAHGISAAMVERMLSRLQSYVPKRLWQAAMQAAPKSD